MASVRFTKPEVVSILLTRTRIRRLFQTAPKSVPASRNIVQNPFFKVALPGYPNSGFATEN